MIVLLIVVAAVATIAPVTLIVVVSAASRREEAAWTLGAPAPGLLQAAGRHLVGFYSEAASFPRPKSMSEREVGEHPRALASWALPESGAPRALGDLDCDSARPGQPIVFARPSALIRVGSLRRDLVR